MENKFKEGDIVYSLTRGEGEVVSVQNHDYGVVVSFKELNVSPPPVYFYLHDGKFNSVDLIPDIYHTKPQIIIPKRKVKREKQTWCLTEYLPLMGTENISLEESHLYTKVTISWEEKIEG